MPKRLKPGSKTAGSRRTVAASTAIAIATLALGCGGNLDEEVLGTWTGASGDVFVRGDTEDVFDVAMTLDESHTGTMQVTRFPGSSCQGDVTVEFGWSVKSTSMVFSKNACSGALACPQSEAVDKTAACSGVDFPRSCQVTFVESSPPGLSIGGCADSGFSLDLQKK